ncbi:MAG: biotin--[acetyl-CoA-carboxylase] ligase [Anaerolineaceae bacterium]
MNKQELTALLHDLPLGEIRWYDSIPSTNTCALEWLQEFPPEYALMVTDQQTAGYGRNQRTWHSQAGASLTFSFIVHPDPIEQDRLPLFSALAALAVCDAITSYSPKMDNSVKWPNDVLLNRKKAAGILAEAAWQGNKLAGLVIGIGVNMQPAALPPTNDLLFPATSLEQAMGRCIDRWDLLYRILAAFIDLRAIFPSLEFMDAWRRKLAFLGEAVTISKMGEELQHGIFMGVDKQGYLILKEKNGRISTYPLGDVSLRPNSL